MAKLLSSADEAAELIRDGMTVGVSGFGAFASPDCILDAIKDRYRRTGSPKGLAIVSGIAPGDFHDDGCGLSKISDDGLVDTMIASHLIMSPPIGRAIIEEKIAAYSIPLGVYAQLLAAIGSKRPGILTKIGLGTYADPRSEGCRMNEKAKKQNRQIVELVNVDGQDYMFYKSFHIDACILHGSYADEAGNISVEDEPIRAELNELAAAVHNNGGIVIVEVKDIAKAGTLDPRHILLHKSYVDYVVKAVNEDSNIALVRNPSFFGEKIVPCSAVEPLPLNIKKVIARRALMELSKNSLVNLGIGIPASVANVANEEGLSGDITLSLETGVYGGVPLDGPLFGCSVNPECIARSADMFTLYDGGGLDIAVLGCAEVDPMGNVNVSKFNGRCVGPGGFVNISQNTPKICFAFGFTSGKKDITVENGRLCIHSDGPGIKFVKKVGQITFSGEYAEKTRQNVLFVTERAVFHIINGKLTLTEIAPGADLQRDVLGKMAFRPDISPDLKTMDPRIFRPSKMGLHWD